jgi:hypothetical protein
MLAMSNAAKPEDAPGASLEARVQALIALRDELRALNARLEYVALMLRLSRSQSGK